VVHEPQKVENHCFKVTERLSMLHQHARGSSWRCSNGKAGQEDRTFLGVASHVWTDLV